METFGEKILDFFKRFNPERMDRKIQKSLEKLSEDTAKSPAVTEEEERRNEYFLNFILAVGFFAFIYMMYRILF